MTLVQQEALALAVTAATTLGLAIFVYLKNPTCRLNRIFGLYALSIAWWSAWESLADITATHSVPFYEFAQRVEHIGIFLIPVAFLHFVHELTGHSNRRLIRWGYSVSILLIACIPTRWMIAGSAPRYYWPRTVVVGPLYNLGFLFFITVVTYGTVSLWLAYRAASGLRQSQLRYFLVATLIGYIGGTADFAGTYNLRLPFLNPYGIYGVAIYAIITAYAIVRHQLFDIHVLIRKSLIYSLLVGALTIVYFCTALALERVFQEQLGYRSFSSTLVVFLLITLVFQPLRVAIQRMVDQLIFRVPQQHLARRLEVLEVEVREADKAKAVSRLAAGIAHEIKNPISAITTFVQALSERHEEPEFLQQFLEVVGQELLQLQRLAQGLVDFAKPHTAGRTVVDLRVVLEQVMALTRADLDKKDIVVKATYAHDSVGITADPGHLRQAFLNLILNARDAMAHAGPLNVATRVVEGRQGAREVEVTITDTGQGIAPADLTRLFEPFFTRKAHGTGLGLSIVQRIIQEHSGTIEVASRLARGTTFTVRLPI